MDSMACGWILEANEGVAVAFGRDNWPSKSRTFSLNKNIYWSQVLKTGSQLMYSNSVSRQRTQDAEILKI